MNISDVKRRPIPRPALAIDEITSTATSTGAIPFNALTNIRPKMPTPPHCGTVRPSTAPMTKPMKIRNIKLTDV